MVKFKNRKHCFANKIALFQDDSLLYTTNINDNDTTLFVENLQPNQNYTFHSTIEQFNNGKIKSNSISVTTIDYNA